jgi:hypothetical protein
VAVTFTANIGLAKPDDTELAKNWATATQLANDNNVIIAAKMNIALTAYTPTVVAATTAPNFGTTATILGEYTDFQGFITGTFTLTAGGTGILSGTGNWGISLPFNADAAFHSVGANLNEVDAVPSCIGEGYFYDDSSSGTSVMCSLDVCSVSGVHYMRMVTEALTGKTSQYVSGAAPAALASLDSISGSFYYKKA